MFGRVLSHPDISNRNLNLNPVRKFSWGYLLQCLCHVFGNLLIIFGNCSKFCGGNGIKFQLRPGKVNVTEHRLCSLDNLGSKVCAAGLSIDDTNIGNISFNHTFT